MASVVNTAFLTSDKFADTIIEYSGTRSGPFLLGGEESAGLTGDLCAEIIFGVGFLASSPDSIDLTSYGVASLFC